MSNSDIFALLQTIFAGIGIFIAIIGGILGVLGYLKIMRGIDDNARERQAAIDASAEKATFAIKDMANKVELMQTRNKYAMAALCIVLGGFLTMSMIENSRIRKEWKELKNNK